MEFNKVMTLSTQKVAELINHFYCVIIKEKVKPKSSSGFSRSRSKKNYLIGFLQSWVLLLRCLVNLSSRQI